MKKSKKIQVGKAWDGYYVMSFLVMMCYIRSLSLSHTPTQNVTLAVVVLSLTVIFTAEVICYYHFHVLVSLTNTEVEDNVRFQETRMAMRKEYCKAHNSLGYRH